MTKDQLSPEDRALYDAFFRAYGLKYAELHAAAGDGAEISLDACTVHAIKAMTARETGRRFDLETHLERQIAFSLATFGPGRRTAGVVDHIRKELLEIEADPEDAIEWVDVIILGLDGAWRAGLEPREIVAAIVAKQTKNEARTWPDWRTADRDKAIEHDRSQDSAPRIVSAVGVGVRVKPPEEPASLYEQIVAAIKTAPSGRKLEAINEVIKNAKVETPKLSAEAIETMRAARQCYGACEWWDEITTQVGTLRRFKSSTCGAPEWRNEGANYPVGLTLEQYFAEVGRCQCGRVVVIRGEDELEEGGE